MSAWTFITNYGAVLALIAREGRIAAREIAQKLRITERSVHRIISELEAEGYLEKMRDGRVNSYKVHHELPLRRPEQRDTAVGELLDILLPEPKERETGRPGDQQP